jgi:hypothetical protein
VRGPPRLPFLGAGNARISVGGRRCGASPQGVRDLRRETVRDATPVSFPLDESVVGQSLEVVGDGAGVAVNHVSERQIAVTDGSGGDGYSSGSDGSDDSNAGGSDGSSDSGGSGGGAATSSSGPGFGVGAVVVAMVALMGAAVARRR